MTGSASTNARETAVFKSVLLIVPPLESGWPTWDPRLASCCCVVSTITRAIVAVRALSPPAAV